ncbi:uncharacterized protein F4812DRAFT_422693 [Daldinia caldariorum]|uniref:uncharacterized protein n=1 Tax=Daldinia caldariorum TaxID=326644 RepID=UPI002007DA08|nr:uncharacterized protein F4812DRAFT_422693 [Daldinia caldariorum]KAI1469321.1 hypothetical protein F4812DRAFT_422693 [Daldinia caldariorum]
MYRAYYLDYRDYERNTFGADELVIRPIPLAVETIEPPPASTPAFHVDVSRESLGVRRQRDRDSLQIASAHYSTKGHGIELKVGEESIKLTRSQHAQTDAGNQSHSTHKWKSHSKWNYSATLPDGLKLKWELVGQEHHRESIEKNRTQAAKTQPRLRCVQEGSGAKVLGEMMKSNDVVRLMTGDDDIHGERATLGLCVLLGFVSLYERARASDRGMRKFHLFRRRRQHPSLTGKTKKQAKRDDGITTDKPEEVRQPRFLLFPLHLGRS